MRSPRSRRRTGSTLTAITAVASMAWLLPVGCGSDDTPAGTDASSTPDARVDAPPAQDGGKDAAKDAGATDAGHDAAIDSPIDAPADAAIDSPIDAKPDAPADAAADADAAPLPCTDVDGDGYGAGGGCLGPDCDDTNPFVNPGRQELADDGLDNDCAGGNLTAAAGPGVYVNNALGGGCSDSAFGHGSKTTPYCSIELATIEAQSAGGNRNIFVAKGTYPHIVGFAANMNLYGGYDAAAWTYDPIANETIIGDSDYLDSLDSTTCRNGPGCSAQCVCVDYDGWVSINSAAASVFQGFTIRGGKRNGPLFGLTINSSAQVTVAYSKITAGQGIQTVTVQIPGTATNVLLYKNVITGGTPTSSSAFGVNNLGVATLFGNRIGAGPGSPTSFATAVQNYKKMTLIANVINAGDDGANTPTSAGFYNNVLQGVPATAVVLNNAIFGGRGSDSSIGLLNAGVASIVDNVLGGRLSTPATWGQQPVTESDAFLVAFSATTKLHANTLFTPIYAGEPSPPNTAAKRHAMHDPQLAKFLETPAELNTCDWTGCQSTGGNVTVDPTFVAAPTDFHIPGTSACKGAGIDVSPYLPIGPGRVDIDGTLRPAGGWDIGIDEIP
jgi:hypothetical protein